MAMFDNPHNEEFDVMNYVNVKKSLVDECKRSVLTRLKENKSIELREYYDELNNYMLEYNPSNKEDEIKVFAQQISKFMATQEALSSLVSEGIIIPLATRNNINDSMSFNYETSDGMNIFRGNRHIVIPIIYYQKFMLNPSEVYK